MQNKCTYIDGIASSQAIDTAGEIVDILGLDCSSLLGAAFNWEHKSDVPAQIVGKVLDYKKIFSAEDCDTDRQKKYWKKVNMPFLYVMGRLLDDKKESAKEVAALMLDDAQNPHEPQMLGFSIEGAKINKEGMTITRSIARKVTITNMPANKTCVAEMVPSAKRSAKNDPESLFKGEIELFTPSDKYLEFLSKKEQDMEKDVGTGGGAFIGDSLAMGELAKSAPSWTHTGGGNFSHPEHGIVSVAKQPSGEFHVRHNGAMAGLGGQKGSFPTAAAAGAHAGNYMRAVGQKKVLAPISRPSPTTFGKSLEAGSGMAAPGALTQGAALGKEEIDGKMKKAGFGGGIGIISGAVSGNVPKGKTAAVGTAMNTVVGKSMKKDVGLEGGMGTMGLSEKTKSTWLARAEEAYNTWEKREHFENFMKAKMPHLTKGEIKAIGQTLALKKSVEAEKTMSKMFSSYFGKSKK
jgi:hypothetical protein